VAHPGAFSPDLVPVAWFDPDMQPSGWFADELIADGGTPPEPEPSEGGLTRRFFTTRRGR